MGCLILTSALLLRDTLYEPMRCPVLTCGYDPTRQGDIVVLSEPLPLSPLEEGGREEEGGGGGGGGNGGGAYLELGVVRAGTTTCLVKSAICLRPRYAMSGTYFAETRPRIRWDVTDATGRDLSWGVERGMLTWVKGEGKVGRDVGAHRKWWRRETCQR
eukprot:3382079-Rhodomonas_salina.1